MSHRRLAPLAFLAVASLGAGAANAQPSDPPVIVHAEDCLSAHVGRVVADDADLQSAASFLVNYACAHEISKAQDYENNLLIASQLNAMVKNMGGLLNTRGAPSNGAAPVQAPPIDFTATVDPQTGELVIPPAPPGPVGQMLTTMTPQAMRQATALMSGGAVPERLRALAGELVIDAYERQHAAGRVEDERH